MNNIFKEIKTEVSAYLLGFISADGCLTKGKNSLRIELQKGPSEIKLIHQIHTILKLETKIYYPKNKNSILLIASDKEMKKDLAALGITPAKTFTVPFINLHPKLMRHYIRGYFDGDGWISFSKANNYSYITTGVAGNNLFCKQLNNYLKSVLGFSFSNTKKGKITQLQSSGCYKCHTFLSYIYKDSAFYLDRKKLLYKNLDVFIQKKEEDKKELKELKCPNCYKKSLVKYGSKTLKKGICKKYKCTSCKKSTIKPINNIL